MSSLADLQESDRLVVVYPTIAARSNFVLSSSAKGELSTRQTRLACMFRHSEFRVNLIDSSSTSGFNMLANHISSLLRLLSSAIIGLNLCNGASSSSRLQSSGCSTEIPCPRTVSGSDTRRGATSRLVQCIAVPSRGHPSRAE